MTSEKPDTQAPAPWTDGNPLQALVRAFGLLERVMQPYFAQFGISASQWGILRTLHRAESEHVAGLRLTDLSERLLVRPPSVTGAVDRLVRAGLVAREASASDLRAKHVGLTLRGRQCVEQVLAVHGSQVDSVLGGLSPAERSQLQQLLDKLIGHMDKILHQGVGPHSAHEPANGRSSDP
jgi:DNA-binding MarR family transcriptional regulator